jgi:serine protease Do
MTRKQVIFVILSSIIIGGISGWIFVRVIAPKLNSLPLFVKYNWQPANPPLVINTREEVRVIEGSDSVAAIQKARPWLVGIMSGRDLATAKVQSSGIILTGDGLIATSKNSFAVDALTVNVLLSDGRVLPAKIVATDPASELALIKVEANNLPTSSFGVPNDLRLGQRMILLSSTMTEFQANNVISHLATELKNRKEGVLSADRIHTTFAVNETDLAGVQEGSMVLSLDAQVHGVYTTSGIITADAIKSGMNSYFKNGKIVRNSVGLNYQYITKGLSEALKLPVGVIIKRSANQPAVVLGSPAAQAGLLEDDVITKVNETDVNADNSFEDLLSRFTPGETVRLRVERKGEIKNINLNIGSRQE